MTQARKTPTPKHGIRTDPNNSRRRLYTCYYCGTEGTRKDCEFDHFPIPYSEGGQSTVVACKLCHTMKDRYPFDRLPPHYTQRLLMFTSLPYEWDRLKNHPDTTPDDWNDWDTPSRIVWAKISRLIQQSANLEHPLVDAVERALQDQ